MSSSYKISRNDPCPCGNKKKYKNCCYEKIDWEKIFRSGEDYRSLLSVRGRNILFLNVLADILQLDKIDPSQSNKKFKAAFTANNVKRIHQAILDIWPQNLNISEVLKRSATDVSGLYVGDYEPRYITRGIIRHSIYANKILIIDPFMYPLGLRPEYNPIINPEQYRTQTLRNVNFWISLSPWIEEGLIEIIRTPADFDRKLNWILLKEQQNKFASNAELREAAHISSEQLKERYRGEFTNELLLSSPDSYIRGLFDKLHLAKEGITADQFISYIESERENHPDFLEPLNADSKSGQMRMIFSGAGYNMAKLTATLTKSYLVTDLHSRWREIELDREQHDAENKVWAPFAKALQETTLTCFDKIHLEHAMTIRKEGQLESLRAFLRKVWKNACSDDPFDSVNAQLLADELLHEIKKAEEEWRQIDRNLIKIVGTEIGAGLLSANSLITSGHAYFLAAALVTSISAAVLTTASQQMRFPDKFPAAFFMKLDSERNS